MWENKLLDYLETIVFIQADVVFILGIEVTGKLLHIQPAKHRCDQPACNPLFLVCGINADEKQVVVGIGSMFFMKIIDCVRKRHKAIHNFFPNCFWSLIPPERNALQNVTSDLVDGSQTATPSTAGEVV
jgi:hypothetical protein